MDKEVGDVQEMFHPIDLIIFSSHLYHIRFVIRIIKYFWRVLMIRFDNILIISYNFLPSRLTKEVLNSSVT